MSSSSFSDCLPSLSVTSHAISISDGSKPGIGPADVSIITSATTRAVSLHRDATGDHAAHRVAEQPELIES